MGNEACTACQKRSALVVKGDDSIVFRKENSTRALIPEQPNEVERKKIMTNRKNLEIAIDKGDIEPVKQLLVQFDVNHVDRVKMTLLMYAVQMGKNDIVKMLIDTKADITVEDVHHKTALLRAAENHTSTNSQEVQIQLIETLINAKANINAETKKK